MLKRQKTWVTKLWVITNKNIFQSKFFEIAKKKIGATPE